MIHSLAGGDMRFNNLYDIIKVEILEGMNQGDKNWFLGNASLNLKDGDIVIVPLGRNETFTKAKVLRVDKNVPEHNFPIPIKRMKEVIRKVDNEL